MGVIGTRQKLTKIIWYKDFGAKFTKPVRQGTGSKSTGSVSRACFKSKQFSRATYPTRSWSAYPVPVHPCIASLLHPLISYQWWQVHSQSLLPPVVPAVLRPHVPTVHTAHMALFKVFAQAMCNPAQVAQLWVALMAAQTMVQKQGRGQSIQQQGGRQTAQLAGSKTGRHEPAAGAADKASKLPNTRGKKSKRS